MLRARCQLKILNGIVLAVAITMMHQFVRCERPAEVPRHDQPVGQRPIVRAEAGEMVDTGANALRGIHVSQANGRIPVAAPATIVCCAEAPSSGALITPFDTAKLMRRPKEPLWRARIAVLEPAEVVHVAHALGGGGLLAAAHRTRALLPRPQRVCWANLAFETQTLIVHVAQTVAISRDAPGSAFSPTAPDPAFGARTIPEPLSRAGMAIPANPPMVQGTKSERKQWPLASFHGACLASARLAEPGAIMRPAHAPTDGGLVTAGNRTLRHNRHSSLYQFTTAEEETQALFITMWEPHH